MFLASIGLSLCGFAASLELLVILSKRTANHRSDKLVFAVNNKKEKTEERTTNPRNKISEYYFSRVGRRQASGNVWVARIGFGCFCFAFAGLLRRLCWANYFLIELTRGQPLGQVPAAGTRTIKQIAGQVTNK